MTEGGGLTLVVTGEGPTGLVAAGMVLRALGQGLRVLVCPPAGTDVVYRELDRALSGLLAVCTGDVRTWLAAVAGAMAGGERDMVVLPAVDRVLDEGLGPDLAALVCRRPPGLHLVLAGRGDLSKLAGEADLVTRLARRK